MQFRLPVISIKVHIPADPLSLSSPAQKDRRCGNLLASSQHMAVVIQGSGSRYGLLKIYFTPF